MAAPDYTTLTLMRSSTASAEPTTADLTDYGEIAINVADRKIFARDNANNIIVMDGGNDHTHISSQITDLTEVINTAITEFYRPTIIEDATTARTISATDETALIYFTSSSAITVTIPLEASEALPDGFIVHLHQAGTGQITVAGEGAVTVNSSVSLLSARRYSALSLMKTGTDRWTLVGDQD